MAEREISLIDGQKTVIQECYNCGGHFVISYISNLIGVDTAENLDSVNPQGLTPSQASPTCPTCLSRLVRINDDSVARGVTVFSCREGHGSFFPKSELIKFKKAQKAKIDYHQLWGIPLKSAFAVLLPVFAIFTAIVATPTIMQEVQKMQDPRIKANGLIMRPIVTPLNNTKVIISFDSYEPQITTLILKKGSETAIFNGTGKKEKTHIFTLEDLIPNTLYSYNINIEGKITDNYSFTTLPE